MAKREARAAESGVRWDNTAEHEDQDVVDYSSYRTTSKVPSYGPQPAQRRQYIPELVDYPAGGHAAPRSEDRLDYSKLSAADRHDRVRAERAARAEAERFGDTGTMTYESVVETWQDLQSRNEQLTNDRVVSFHVPPIGSPAYGPQPQPRVNALGQSIPKRRWDR